MRANGDRATRATVTVAAGIRGPPPYIEGMPDAKRDPIQEWLLPQHRRPPLLGELVERIDEALATARASEAAVMTVGAAALDAAEQAHRAAGLAERASAAVAGGRESGEFPLPPSGRARGAPRPRSREDDLSDFTARADRIAERLRRLQRLPLST